MCIQISLVLLLIFLLIAVITDFLFDKVFNVWIAVGVFCGLIDAVWRGGGEGLFWGMIYMVIPVFLLYPLFMIGCMGAGDLKLFAVIGSFLPVRELMLCLAAAFSFGAVFALLKMIKERNFIERMKYMISYFAEVMKTGIWKIYEESPDPGGQNGDGQRASYKNKIHFTLPIFLGVIFCKGGFFV